MEFPNFILQFAHTTPNRSPGAPVPQKKYQNKVHLFILFPFVRLCFIYSRICIKLVQFHISIIKIRVMNFSLD